jgi:magnesium chelatase family protein
MSTAVQSIITRGGGGVVVDIECHLSNNLPNIVIVGYANRAVDESRERLRGAFANSRLLLPRKRITVNLAPADIPKADSGFDLAIAVAILLAGGQLSGPPTEIRQAFIGELGLDGSVRAVRGLIGKLLAGRAKGITTFYIPTANLDQARLVPAINLYPVESLGQLYRHLAGDPPLTPVTTGPGSYDPPSEHLYYGLRLSDVVGQAHAKRALEIAAAGGHNVFFSGPPGTGKSMLAKTLPSLLPPLSREEILEVTHLHSLAGHDYEAIVSERPFRAPHHSASHIAVVGGGASLRPGEITLAHHGVLFFDELPEFGRLTLEALRQPLEDRIISIARARDTIEYPASFILVATANPCPCGYYGTGGDCRCLPGQIIRYRQKLSGPILDRIDLYSNVHEVKHDKLLTQVTDPATDAVVRQRIRQARTLQTDRFGSCDKLNAGMDNADIKRHGHLESTAVELLNAAAKRLNVSARSYMRCVKVARTIADLEQSPTITTAHISEALAYRNHTYRD